VQITHDGFAAGDREVIDEASASAMAATSSGLNMTRFVKFSKQVEKATTEAMKAKATTPLTTTHRCETARYESAD
jgi:hypothetical protein